MSSNDLITNVGKNSNDTAALVWSVADDLVGAYKPHEYGLVILPMTVIKRFHDCLLPTHQAVLDTYKKVEKLAVKDGFLRKASGYQFYNTSPFTFQKLIADPENIVDNFKTYLSKFSDNVQDILARMDFDAQIKHMEEAGLLYQVISDFCTEKGDFSPEKISAVDMGYVFENLVRRFSESYNEEAGAHFTSRDIIYLMTWTEYNEYDAHRRKLNREGKEHNLSVDMNLSKTYRNIIAANTTEHLANTTGIRDARCEEKNRINNENRVAQRLEKDEKQLCEEQMEKVSQNNPEHQEEDKNKDPFAPNLDFRAAMDMFEEGDF